MASPREVGGFDVHPATQVEVFESLGQADLSSAWVAMIQAETAGMVGAHLPDGDGLDAVFGGDFPRVCGTANPEGRATPAADSGYQLHGRYAFASGIRHCGWVLANAVVANPDAPPRIIGCVVPLPSLIVEDSWDVMGLEGTGSCHYRADGVAVSPDFVQPFGGVHAQRGGPWFHLPTITFLSPGHTGIALGAARRALDLAGGESSARTRFGSTAAIADRPAFQRDYGRAQAAYAAARAYALSTLDDAMTAREHGDPVTPADDARIRAMVTWVTDACLEVVRFAHHCGGGAAAFHSHPLQQVQRDLIVAAQHVYVADSAYERHGAHLLHRPPPGAL